MHFISVVRTYTVELFVDYFTSLVILVSWNDFIFVEWDIKRAWITDA